MNIILGVIYTVFVLITMPGAWTFYIFLGSVDVILTALNCVVCMDVAQAGSNIKGKHAVRHPQASPKLEQPFRDDRREYYYQLQQLVLD